MTTDYNKTNKLSPTTRKLTGHNLPKTQSPLSKEKITSDIQKPTEVTHRCTLRSQTQHAHSLEDHTSNTLNTKHSTTK